MTRPTPTPVAARAGSETGGDAAPAAGRRGETIQSVAVAARFLTVLSRAEGPLPLGQIASLAGTGNSSAHRYMQSLVREGLAVQDPASGQYDLGPAALSIGTAALRRIDPVTVAARHCRALTREIAASAGIAIWTERGPTLVRWYRSAMFSISSLGLGDILPLDNSACGLVFQAFLPLAQIDRARQLQPADFRGHQPASEVLGQVRQNCRSDLLGHLVTGITGQAVPVFDAQGEICCVMTTVANIGQSDDPGDRDALFRAARAVAEATGCPMPLPGV